MGTQGHGDTRTWGHEDMGTYGPEDMGTYVQVEMGTWGHMGTRTWEHEDMDTRGHEIFSDFTYLKNHLIVFSEKPEERVHTVIMPNEQPNLEPTA